MSDHSDRPGELISALGLQPHPEGGYFKEVFRSSRKVQTDGQGVERTAATSIYFLLTAADHSCWHIVAWDEIWHFYEGGPLELLTVDPEKMAVERRILGLSGSGSRQVLAIPGGHWQAARPLGEFTLCGCTVAPGFEFSDLRFVRDLPEAEIFSERNPEFARLL